MSIQDLGFFPEPMVVGLKSSQTSLQALQEMLPDTFGAAQLATRQADDPSSDSKIIQLINSGTLSEQAWSLVGMRLRKNRLGVSPEAIAAVEHLAKENSFVVVDAADCLLTLERGEQSELLKQLLRSSDPRATNYITYARALNVLDRHRLLLTEKQIETIKRLPARVQSRRRGTDDIEKLISTFYSTPKRFG